MALLEGHLRTWLLEQPAIAALVEDRVYKTRMQQKSRVPAIVVSMVSNRVVESFAGYANLRIRRWQLDLYADEASHDDLDTLGEAVFRALEGFYGQMGSAPGTRVQRAHMLSEFDLDEQDVKLYRRTQDWEIFEEG